MTPQQSTIIRHIIRLCYVDIDRFAPDRPGLYFFQSFTSLTALRLRKITFPTTPKNAPQPKTTPPEPAKLPGLLGLYSDIVQTSGSQTLLIGRFSTMEGISA
jgi:hypothetical protein